MDKKLKDFPKHSVNLGVTCPFCNKRFGLIVDVDEDGTILEKQHENVLIDYAEYEDNEKKLIEDD